MVAPETTPAPAPTPSGEATRGRRRREVARLAYRSPDGRRAESQRGEGGARFREFGEAVVFFGVRDREDYAECGEGVHAPLYVLALVESIART